MSRRVQKQIWRRNLDNPKIDINSFVSKSYLMTRSKGDVVNLKLERHEQFTELSIVPRSKEGHWIVLQIGTRRALWMDLDEFERAYNHVIEKFQSTEGFDD